MLEADLVPLGLGLRHLRARLEEREVLPDAEPEAQPRAEVGVADERVVLLDAARRVAPARRAAEEQFGVVVRPGDGDERVARPEPRRRLPQLGPAREAERLIRLQRLGFERNRLQRPATHDGARPQHLPPEPRACERLLLLDLGAPPEVFLFEEAELEEVGVGDGGVALVEQPLQLAARGAERFARLDGDGGEGVGEEDVVVELARAEGDLARLLRDDSVLDGDPRFGGADRPAELAPREERLEGFGLELVVRARILPIVSDGGVEVERVAGQRGAVAVEAGGNRVARGEGELGEEAGRARLARPRRREVAPRPFDGDLGAPVERQPHRFERVHDERVGGGLPERGRGEGEEEGEPTEHGAERVAHRER